MRPLDPTLIDSFPAPPTHFPSTPTSPNPPPSRPPSIPLPPLPSRINSVFSLASESIADIDVKDILHAIQDDDDEHEHEHDHNHDHHLSDMLRVPTHTPRYSIADPIDPHAFHPSPLIDPPRPPRSPPSPDIPTIISTTPRPAVRPRPHQPAHSSAPTSSPRPRANTTIATTHHKRSQKPQPHSHTPTRPTRTNKYPIDARSSELPYVTPYRHYGDSPYGIYGDNDEEDDQGAFERDLMGLADDDDDQDDDDDDEDDTRSWIDHDEFGKPITLVKKRRTQRTKAIERLEKQLEGADSDASDSSLDLHTPLPHLMVRLGLLSPKSKLVVVQPQPNGPGKGEGDGRRSVASLASTTSTATKGTAGGGLLKDSRNTERRRTRHRDGKLLRGGIGLTTGLGWSDSEDEDAPSALTRRISLLNLSRSSSLASLSASASASSGQGKRRSTLSHSTSFHHTTPSTRISSATALSRSYSSGTLGEGYTDTGRRHRGDARDEDIDEWGVKSTRVGGGGGGGGSSSMSSSVGAPRARTPSRWSSHSLPVVASRTRLRTPGIGVVKDRSIGGGGGGGGGSARTSVASSNSNSSIGMYDGAGAGGVILEEDDLGILIGGGSGGGGGSTMGGSARTRNRTGPSIGAGTRNYSNNTTITAPTQLTSSPSTASTSTASSLSIPLPITPLDADALLDQQDEEEQVLIKGASIAKVKRDKSLPPLPPVLRRSPGSSNLAGRVLGSGSGVDDGMTRMRATSASASVLVSDFGVLSSSSTDVPSSGRRVRVDSHGSINAGGTGNHDIAVLESRQRMTTPRPLRLAQSPLLLSSLPSSTSPLPSPLLLTPGKSQDGTSPSSATAASNTGGSFGYRSLRSRSPIPTLTTPPLSSHSALSFPPLPSPGLGVVSAGSSSSMPTTPTTATGSLGEKPKPRTGTGMVYRTAGSLPPPATRMRVPSTVERRPPVVVVSGGGGGGGVGDTTSGRPIAL